MPSLEPAARGAALRVALPGDLLRVHIKKVGKIGRIGHPIHGDRRTHLRGIG